MSKEVLLKAFRTIQQLESKLSQAQASSAIAVVGMACRFPGADNPHDFFAMLQNGDDVLREVPSDRWAIEEYYHAQPGMPGKMYTRSGYFVGDIQGFDNELFKIAPREARMMDPQQRLLLEVCWEGLEQTGLLQQTHLPIGLFIGAMHLEYGALAARLGDEAYYDVHSGTGCEMSVLAGRLAHCLNLTGPAMVVGTACSSSLVAVHLACQSLRAGECRAALAGGVSLMLTPDMTSILCRMGALAADGRTKAFDNSADGYGRGEGAGVVVLKRLNDAIEDGDQIWGVIRGSAVNHDGSSGGLTVPNPSAQESVVRRALKLAQLSPDDVDYIETHGTGTVLGDPIELAALARVFAPRSTAQPLRIGSVKANVGHLEAAAGMASLQKVLLAFKHQTLPKQLHFNSPNRHVPWGSIPIEVPKESVAWNQGLRRRIAGISSFGLSGINAHIILEEPPQHKPQQKLTPTGANQPAPQSLNRGQLLALSAATPKSLLMQASSLADFIERQNDIPLSEICCSWNTSRSQLPYRWSTRVDSRSELLQLLRQLTPQDIAHQRAARIGMIVCDDALPPAEFLQQSWVAKIRSELAPQLGQVPTEAAKQHSMFLGLLVVGRCWLSFGVVPDHFAVVGPISGCVAQVLAGRLSPSQAWQNCLALDEAANPLVANNSQTIELDRSILLCSSREHALEKLQAQDLDQRFSSDEIYDDCSGTLARSFTLGRDLNWRNIYAGQARRLSLPTYAFDRLRHWVTPSSSSTTSAIYVSAKTTSAVRMPGTTIKSPALTDLVFQIQLTESSLDYLAQHRVAGDAVLPAATMLAWFHEVLSRSEVVHADLKDFRIREAVRLGTDPLNLQIVFEKSNRISLVSEISSAKSSSGSTEAKWCIHATAEVQSTEVQSTEVARRGEPLELRELSERLNQQLEISDVYQTLEKQGIQYGAAFRLLNNLQSDGHEVLGQIQMNTLMDGEFRMAPNLLDACLQAAAVWNDPQGKLLAPVGIDSFRCLPGSYLPGTYWCHAQMLERRADLLKYDCQLLDQAGNIVAELKGVSLQPAFRLDWFYQIQWQQFTERTSRLKSASHETDFWARLNNYCLTFIRPIVARFNGDLSAIATAQHRLLDRFEQTLSNVTNNTSTDNTPETAEKLLESFPEHAAEVSFVRRVGQSLADVLYGRSAPLDVLFGHGDAEELYQDSPAYEELNRLVAKLVREATELSGDALEILEVGGGTASTTLHVLQNVGLNSCRYTFTDVSPLFVQRAQQTINDYSGMRFKTLDVEQDPCIQGFQAAAYDLILAANVIHATRSLKASLQHIHTLLKPGGKLILLEGTEPHLWMDMTFGLTEGWWRFDQCQVRTNHALLSADHWQTLLEETGFDRVNILPDPVLRQALADQAVIVAQKNCEAVDVKPQWLYLSSVPTQNAIWQQRCIELGINLHIADLADPLCDLESLCRRSWAGIICRFDDDQMAMDGLMSASITNPLRKLLDLALSVIHGVLATGCTRRVWFLTSSTGQPTQVIQATLWGLVRSVLQEHPEVQWRCIDIESAASAEEFLVDQFPILPIDEPQLAVRQGQFWVARLEHHRPTIDGQATEVQLEIAKRGDLDAVRLIPRRSILGELGHEELEIEIHAAGVNFLDVMDVMGVLPIQRDFIGGECAGIVKSVGSQVADFRVGDEVIALAPGSFASHVRVHQTLVSRKPARLNMNEAATLPVALMTAQRAFEAANVRPGERILIHAAAGGVGQAALELARQLDLQVFATVGSAKKVQWLKDQGVQHIYSSRNASFANPILAATNGHGVDIVLNCLKDSFIPESLAALARGGRFIEIGKTEIWDATRVGQIRPDVQYIIYDLAREVREQPSMCGLKLRQLMSSVERQPDWSPIVHQRFDLSRASDAFRYMARGDHIGKIILNPNHSESRWKFSDSGTYLITGAFGGLGLWLCDWLVAQGVKRLMLWGRNRPSAAVKQRLNLLSEQGVEIQLSQVDIGDLAQVQAEVLNAVESGHKLVGVYHCAGVLDDGLIEDLNWDRFLRVLHPKAIGAWNLHVATSQLQLDQFVMFSSAASMLGSPGQTNHAAANAFLDGLAYLRRSRGLPALSINWGAWSEIGSAADKMRQSVGAHGRGVEFISPRLAQQALRELLPTDLSQVGVFPMNWQAFASRFPDRKIPKYFQQVIQKTEAVDQPHHAESWLEKLRKTASQLREKVLADCLQHEVAFILGRTDRPRIDVALRDMGLDSLLALELCNRIGSRLEMTFSPTLLFDYPTIQALVGYLIPLCFGDADTNLQHNEPIATSAEFTEAIPAKMPPPSPLNQAEIDLTEDRSIDELAAELLNELEFLKK